MKKVFVDDQMQSGYSYELIELIGKNFDPLFLPELTPKEMLELGVFGGKYMNDCKNEFPSDWFTKAKLSEVKDISLNYFRRTEAEDQRQIKRWRAFRRHAGAIKKYCEPYDFQCRRKQRQALLHWAYDSRDI